MARSYEFRVDPEVKLSSGNKRYSEVTTNGELEEYLNMMGKAGWHPVNLMVVGTVFMREETVPQESAWELAGRKMIYP